jgi:hypothetical protein
VGYSDVTFKGNFRSRDLKEGACILDVRCYLMA